MPENTEHPTGSYVTVTVTGRVVHSDRNGSLVIEYPAANGFPRREAFDSQSPSVLIAAAGPPSADVLRIEERAARLTADADLNPEESVSAHRDWAGRWNEAYPQGSAVLVRQCGGDMDNTRTTTQAWVTEGHIAVVGVDGYNVPVPLIHVAPAPVSEHERAPA